METLELIDPGSIDGFAGKFLGSGRPLDILINDAGIMAPPLRRDARGYESQFATNGGSTTSGRPTGSPRQPTLSSPSRWTSAVRRMASAPSLNTGRNLYGSGPSPVG